MKELILSLVVWIILWGLFTLLKLPLPAPTMLAGVLWIVWIYLGYLLVNYFIK